MLKILRLIALSIPLILLESQLFAQSGQETNLYQFGWAIYAIVSGVGLIVMAIKLVTIFMNLDQRGDDLPKALLGLVGIVTLTMIIGIIIYTAQKYGIGNQGITNAIQYNR